jgi:hypothetical protein
MRRMRPTDDSRPGRDDALFDLVRMLRSKYRRGSAVWGIASYGCVLGAVLLSASAAFALKALASPHVSVAAGLATAAALLTTLSGVGGFQSKWYANRNAYYELDSLLIDMQYGHLGTDPARRRLQRIIEGHLQSWLAQLGPSPAHTDHPVQPVEQQDDES